MRTPLQSRCRDGFTLVELLIVVAIIALLAAMITPAVMKAMVKGQEARTLNLIHQVGIAAAMYAEDYGDYPPSTWRELLNFPDDVNGDGTDEIFTFPPAPGGDIRTRNEGIEVLTACLATRRGGPYTGDIDLKHLGNTDDDQDGEIIIQDGSSGVEIARFTLSEVTNWSYQVASVELFELVDYWGNPLVYFHNRDYYDYDGWNETLLPPSYEQDSAENMPYLEAGENADDPDNPKTYRCYARGMLPKTGNHPKTESFQLYSWGSDKLPGCAWGTGKPDEDDPGEQPGWTAKSGNLTNWEE